jgi:preprotein translocase subunit SecE
MVSKIQNFVGEVIVELKKVSWPTRKELIDSTWIVLISSIALGVLIGITDFVLSKLLALMIK